MKTLVWRPGSVPAPTTIQRGAAISAQPLAGSEAQSIPSTLVVSTPGDVYAQLVAYGGDVLVFVDTSGGPATIPAGQVWDFKGLGGFCGLSGASVPTVVTIAAGAQVLGLAELQDVRINGAPSAILPSIVPAQVLTMVRARLDSSTPFPMAQVPDGVTLTLDIRGANFNGNGGAPALKLGTTGGGAASNLNMYSAFGVGFGAGSIVQSNVAASGVFYSHDGFIANGALAAACPGLGVITEVTG